MPSSKGEPACHQDHSALVQMAGSKRRKPCIVEHTCSCRHWRALGSHQATSGCAELVPGKRCSQKDPCCTVQGLSGAYVSLLCREYWPHFQCQPQISADEGQRSWCRWKEEGGQGSGLVSRPGRSRGMKAIGRGWPRRIWRLRGHWRLWLSWEAWELRLCWVGRFAS